MTEQHPIAPPPELVEQWAQMTAKNDIVLGNWVYIATQAARWGADQELEACVDWLDDTDCEDPQEASLRLRWHRRPKPPSLKEQAQRILVENGTTLDGRMELDPDDIAILRRAVEQLDD